MFAVALILALLFSTPARAACPWEGPVTSAYASMTTVTINGKSFSVKGQASRAQFVAVLNECGVNGAAVSSFMEWRQMRRFTNISAFIGICCFTPAIVATPITGILAGERKDDMIMALMQQ